MENKLKKVGVNKYQVLRIAGMKAEAVVYANETILKDLENDLSIKQLQEAAMLPKLISPVIGMPDIHEGFGLPIGGVMATEDLISVGAVGMDINCGVRLMTTNLNDYAKLFSRENLLRIIRQIEKLVPVGLGGRRKEAHGDLQLKEVVEKGIKYLINQGYVPEEDWQSIEEYGCLEGANFEALTPDAIKRARKQLGTLGSGNHFIEIQKITEIFDASTSSAWGLFKNQICVMVHCGSRALGHQTCVDYTNIFWQAEDKYGIKVPRKGLAALPINTPEGQNYFAAMAASVNFAFCNRAMITHYLRKIFEREFKTPLKLIYDVAHNIAKWEGLKSKVQSSKFKVLIHRKGATRALPAGHSQNPERYQQTGHPAIVPGSMGAASYVMVGLPKNEETFYSINHGAGRTMSRKQAKRTIKKEDFEKAMGQIVYNKPFHVIADEAPDAYKNIHEVIETLVEAGLTKKVVRLVPLAVIKGD